MVTENLAPPKVTEEMPTLSWPKRFVPTIVAVLCILSTNTLLITGTLGSAKATLAASSITAYRKLEIMLFVPSLKTMLKFGAYCARTNF